MGKRNAFGLIGGLTALLAFLIAITYSFNLWGGEFLLTPVLQWFPLLVHQIFGVLFGITALVLYVSYLIFALSK